MKTTLLTTLLIFSATLLFAQTPTKVTIRAKAKDAKFIGSSIGGAHVIVRDKATGEILTQGKTTGSTGNTKLIMSTPKGRDMAIAEESTAKFVAALNLSEPTFVSVEAVAPVNQKQAAVTSSTELWVIPGRDIMGDGVVLEIPGFVVNVLAPRTHQGISLKSLENNEVSIQANIVMMCGCPITSGGMWDADKMEVQGIFKKDGKVVKEVEMKVGEEANLFSANAALEETGYYELTIFAYNAETGNTGVDKVNFILRD